LTCYFSSEKYTLVNVSSPHANALLTNAQAQRVGHARGGVRTPRLALERHGLEVVVLRMLGLVTPVP
jgi:hypothetical protein